MTEAIQCPSCQSMVVTKQEVMYLVTGQVDGPRGESIVHTCPNCGHRWIDNDERDTDISS